MKFEDTEMERYWKVVVARIRRSGFFEDWLDKNIPSSTQPFTDNYTDNSTDRWLLNYFCCLSKNYHHYCGGKTSTPIYKVRPTWPLHVHTVRKLGNLMLPRCQSLLCPSNELLSIWSISIYKVSNSIHRGINLKPDVLWRLIEHPDKWRMRSSDFRSAPCQTLSYHPLKMGMMAYIFAVLNWEFWMTNDIKLTKGDYQLSGFNKTFSDDLPK